MQPPLRARAYFLFPIVLAIGFGACDSSSSPPEPPLFPNYLDKGESWTYKRIVTNRVIDSSEVDTTENEQLRKEVAKTGVEIGGRSGLIQVNVFEPSAPEKISFSWYQQSPDSLVEVAFGYEGYYSLNRSRDAERAKMETFKQDVVELPLLRQQ